LRRYERQVFTVLLGQLQPVVLRRLRYLLIEDLPGPCVGGPGRPGRPITRGKGRPDVPYVVAALVVTNVLTLLNLLLLFGVIRRLREQPAPPGLPGPTAVPVGTLIDAFTTADTDDRPLRRDDLPEGAVVGFFSPGCAPCEALVPKFVARAEGLPGGREQVVAVVVGPTDEAAGYVARLAPVARVVVEEPSNGVLARAFHVPGYPTVFQLDGDGRVLISDASVDRLAVPTA
jgi:hypothetical protein